MRIEDVAPGRGGWARISFGERDLLAHVAALPTFGGRGDPYLQVDELFVSGPGAITTKLLRSLPVARVEAILNSPGVRRSLLLEHIDDRVESPAGAFKALDRGRFIDEKIQNRAGRHVAKLRIKGAAEGSAGHRRSDAFYHDVAQTWAYAVSNGLTAADIAAANDVKPPTVHRWIRGARQRGEWVMPTRPVRKAPEEGRGKS